MEGESLERVVAKHPCRTNQITFVCEGMGYAIKHEGFESLIRVRFPGLDSEGLLDFVRDDEQ